MLNDFIAFMRLYFAEEMVKEMYRSFLFFERFNSDSYIAPYQDVMALHQLEHTDGIIDQWRGLIEKDTTELLESHGVFVTEDVPLRFKNDLINAIVVLMNLENYDVVMTILEGFKDDVEQFADIVAEYSALDQTEVLENVIRIHEHFIEALKVLARGKRTEASVAIFPQLVTNLSVFTEHIAEVNMAKYLVKDGLRIGESLASYLEMFKDELLLEEDELFAKNFISLALISGDYNNQLLMAFRNNAFMLLGDDTTRVKQIELHVSRLSSEFINLIGNYHEQNRLS